MFYSKQPPFSNDRNLIRSFKGIISLFMPRFKILAYHSIYPSSRDSFEVDVGSFEKQLCFLANNGYRVIGLQQAFGELQTHNLPDKTVAITFDDGFKTLQQFALPVLNHFGFPAYVFLPFAFIGGADNFSCKYPRFDTPILDWDGIEKLLEAGITYGSHTMSHQDLTTLDEVTLQYELEESRRILKTLSETDFYALAYPFGLFDKRVKDAVRETKYDCALCFGNTLSNTRLTDVFELKREKITNSTCLDEFARVVDVRNDFVRKIKSLADTVLRRK